jgi:hypothetical protein
MIGLHFVRFFHKLSWSSWLGLTFMAKSVIGFITWQFLLRQAWRQSRQCCFASCRYPGFGIAGSGSGRRCGVHTRRHRCLSPGGSSTARRRRTRTCRRREPFDTKTNLQILKSIYLVRFWLSESQPNNALIPPPAILLGKIDSTSIACLTYLWEIETLTPKIFWNILPR